MTALKVLLLLCIIICSACLSAAEAALFSLTPFQLRFLKINFKHTYLQVKHLLLDPQGVLITILFINEIFNVTLTCSISQFILHAQFKFDVWTNPWTHTQWTLNEWSKNLFLGLVITAPILLFFCEITPKVIGTQATNLILTSLTAPLTWVYHGLSPIRMILKKMTAFLSQPQQDPEKTLVKESDFITLAEEGLQEGSVHQKELQLIKNVFSLDHTLAEEVMTPLSQILTLPAHTSLQAAFSFITHFPYSRIPIVETKIIGILYTKDLLKMKFEENLDQILITTLMRKPHFIKKSIKLSQLLKLFKQQKTHLGIVKNDLDEVIGIITMDDILKTLFKENCLSQKPMDLKKQIIEIQTEC